MDEQQEPTVVVADSLPQVREGIANLCAARGMRVVGQCGDGETALAMVKTLEPDFAILDVSMPGIGGIEVIRKLRSEHCASKLMIFTISREEAIVLEALRAGADAYLLKDGPSLHVFDAINFVGDGGVYISPLLGNAYDGKTLEDRLASLNSMEMEVFRYVVDGLRAEDIADRLDISPMAVNNHRTSFMLKLGVHDLVTLVKFAIERDLFGEGLAGVPSVIGPRLPHRPPLAAHAEPPEDAS
jgi:DNA-binding NarL/FixJ family response regulator